MKIFLGSSTECKDDMQTVAQWILAAGHTPKPWTDPSLSIPGDFIFSSIIKISQGVDAAILIFGEDDQVWYRNDLQTQARDNVLIEYGLFAATLGTQNTIICRKGNPKTPSDLGGIIQVDLNDSGAEKTISSWVEKLQPKSVPCDSRTLAEIRENLLAIEKPQSRPFELWLCKKHLESTLQAVKAIKEEGNHGALNYKKKVAEHLLPDRIDTILALCGRKFKRRDANENYFAEFYGFAQERKNRRPKHSDNIYVCRIFVKNARGRFPKYIPSEITRHEKHREDGVLRLTIESSKRDDIEAHVGQGFCKCLDEGFGFLIFWDGTDTSTVIIHEGMDKNMAFVELKDELNSRRILEMFKILCRQSVEYNSAREKNNLRKLLSRLQLPVMP